MARPSRPLGWWREGGTPVTVHPLQPQPLRRGRRLLGRAVRGALGLRAHQAGRPAPDAEPQQAVLSREGGAVGLPRGPGVSRELGRRAPPLVQLGRGDRVPLTLPREPVSLRGLAVEWRRAGPPPWGSGHALVPHRVNREVGVGVVDGEARGGGGKSGRGRGDGEAGRGRGAPPPPRHGGGWTPGDPRPSHLPTQPVH